MDILSSEFALNETIYVGINTTCQTIQTMINVYMFEPRQSMWMTTPSP